MTKGRLVVTCALGTFLLVGCGCSMESSASAKISTATGKALYVNRLGRGVSYDVLFLSSDDSRCRAPSERKDVILHDHAGYPLYYSLLPDGAVLLYLQGEAKVPSDFPIRIKQENVHPLDWNGIEARYAAGQIQRIDIRWSGSDDCAVRLW